LFFYFSLDDENLTKENGYKSMITRNYNQLMISISNNNKKG